MAPHHKTAVTGYTLPVTRACDDAGDTPVLPHQVLYRYGLADLSPRPRRGGDEDRVERGSRHREAVGSGRAAEPADHRGPARRDDLHAVQLGVRGALDRSEQTCAQALQHVGRRGAQVLRAWLVAGEAGAIEQQHRRAGAGEQQGRRGPRRAGADDDRAPHHGEPTSATAAPHNVAARLRPSLSSQRHPPVSRTSSWQTVFARSKRASHAGHWYLPWSVAPSSESASMPATPAPVTVANPGAAPRGPNTWASQAIVAAPATPPRVPSAVIPPDVPRVTRRPDVMRRGGKGANAPISVAHVSAAAAAIAPAAAVHAPSSAATVATPPLATTWRAVRRGLCRSATWVRRLPERRNAASNANPPQPRAHVRPAPTAPAPLNPPR